MIKIFLYGDHMTTDPFPKSNSSPEKREGGISPPFFSGESHSFDTGVATHLKSIEAALVLNHIRFWLRNNKAKGVNFIQGRTWTYESAPQISEYFGYLSEDAVRRAIKKLVDSGYLIKGNFDSNPFNKTNWYALYEEELVDCNFTDSIPRNRGMREDPEKTDVNQQKSNNISDSSNSVLDPAKSRDRLANSPDVYKDKDKNIKDKNSSVSEPQFGRLTTYFFEKLKEINPKIKKPNLKKWTEEISHLIRTDERSPEEVRQVIDYIAEQHKNPKREFTWSKAVMSPEKLRKHFAAIWLEMTRVSPEQAKEEAEDQKIKAIKANREWAQVVYEKVKKSLEGNSEVFYRLSDNCVTLEDKTRKIYSTLGFAENGFREIVQKFLRSRGIL
jgi:hypothetical protein